MGPTCQVHLVLFLLLWERKNISFLVQFLFLCWWCINLQIGGKQIALKFSFRYSGRCMPEQFFPLILFLSSRSPKSKKQHWKWAKAVPLLFHHVWKMKPCCGSRKRPICTARWEDCFPLLLFSRSPLYFASFLFFACSTPVYTMRNPSKRVWKWTPGEILSQNMHW